MLAATVAATIAAPAAVIAAAVADLARSRRSLPSVRTFLFALQYVWNDTVEIVFAPLLWIRAGFGATLGSSRSQREHERLQQWSILLLEKRARQLLGIRIETAQPTPPIDRPTIVICRHVSVFDSSLASLLFGPEGVHTRGVIMSEMLNDPGFDIIYQRLGSVFVPRDDGDSARQAIADMTADAPANTAFVIYPEGRLFRPEVLQRSLDRLRETDPVRAARLEQLKHVLPPRPGGFNRLLDALPDAEVILIEHFGFDQIPRLADVAENLPLASPVQVSFRHFARSSIPKSPDGRTEWLDRLWIEVDDSVSRRTAQVEPLIT